MPVPITALFETHLTVSDLERSIAFYRDVVGLPLAHRVPAPGAAFHWTGASSRPYPSRIFQNEFFFTIRSPRNV